MVRIADVGRTDEHPLLLPLQYPTFQLQQFSCGYVVVLDSSGVFVCLALAADEDLLAEIKDG